MTKRTLFRVLALLLVAACLFTQAQFDTLNAPAVALALVRVCLLDAPCARIGSFPRAYLGNPENGFSLFLQTMEHWGYTHQPQEQMGSLCWFTDSDGNWFKVLFRINGCYATWIWC